LLKRYTEENMYLVIDLIEVNISDAEIVNITGFNIAWINKLSTNYWKYKMNIQQIDDYLIKKFPGGSLKQASIDLGTNIIFIKRRVMYLKIDPDMIFETITFKTKKYEK
jgi:hypothetical protein